MAGTKVLIAFTCQNRSSDITVFPDLFPCIREGVRTGLVQDVRLVRVTYSDVSDLVTFLVDDGHACGSSCSPGVILMSQESQEPKSGSV